MLSMQVCQEESSICPQCVPWTMPRLFQTINAVYHWLALFIQGKYTLSKIYGKKAFQILQFFKFWVSLHRLPAENFSLNPIHPNPKHPENHVPINFKYQMTGLGRPGCSRWGNSSPQMNPKETHCSGSLTLLFSFFKDPITIYTKSDLQGEGKTDLLSLVHCSSRHTSQS